MFGRVTFVSGPSKCLGEKRRRTEFLSAPEPDERGSTVASHLSRRRDMAAAKAFFRKALKRHGEPRTITLDGFEPSHAAVRRMGMRNEFNFRWENPVKIRSCQYLNNSVLKQYGGAGSPTHQDTDSADARLQDVPQCAARLGWH